MYDLYMSVIITNVNIAGLKMIPNINIYNNKYIVIFDILPALLI